MNDMKFRKANLTDAELLLFWRNDVLTRQSSHNTNSVLFEDHIKWLQNVLSSSFKSIFIAEFNNIPVGTIRKEITDKGALISWTVAPDQRGKGYGKELVRNFCAKNNEKYIAEVKIENTSSKKIAEYAGFTLDYEQNGVLYFVKIPIVKD